MYLVQNLGSPQDRYIFHHLDVIDVANKGSEVKMEKQEQHHQVHFKLHVPGISVLHRRRK